MKKCINTTHIEGLLYEHKLELKESGPNSKNPGTKFISGTVDITNSTATGFANINNGLWNELNNNTKVPTDNFDITVDGVNVH
mgnify:CR=1 FL=1